MSITSLPDLLSLYRSDARVTQVAQTLEEPNARLRLSGLLGSGPALIAASVVEKRGGTHLFVLRDREEAAYFLNDLVALQPPLSPGEGPGVRAFFFPAPSRSPYDPDGHHDAERVTRTEVLEMLMSSASPGRTAPLFIITWPEALVPLVIDKEALAKSTLTIKRGEELPIDTLEEWLHESRFTRADFVYEPGQFSIRGGIVDVFSYGSDKPYRIELFGDTVESVRRFDPQDQLTVEFLKEAVIVPDLVEEPGQRRQTFLDQLPEGTTLWLHDLQAIGDAANERLKRLEEAYARLEDKDRHKAPQDLLAKDAELVKATLGLRKVFWGSSHEPRVTNQEPRASSLELRADSRPSSGPTLAAHGSQLMADPVDFSLKPQPAFAKDFKVLSGDLHNKRNAGYTNLIACNSAKQSERLYAIFQDMEHEVSFTPLMLDLHEGFVDPVLKLALYTDHQIFERYHRYRLKEGFRRNAQALTLKELTQLKPGDLVVHIDHGIGVFSGLETIDAGGSKQEAIRLKYRDNDILYVGIHSLHRVSKYSGEEGGKAPLVSKLGSPAWKNLKEKTKAKVKALAFDLIQLYAQRKGKPGFAFRPDTYLQHELEASFIYEDTPDQEKATADVKRDMEKPVPMDRLVCGDVGFGKTEVAIRAAFKAATDGKQVAVLVPTTILALQHYKTFRERMKDLPVRVDYINRFRSSKDQRQVLKDLKEGKIDILVGTHRLVGKDVQWKDLGLLIIDEEQKFGVNVKDKLKTLRANVDTLTLTATPIPRTLQFSLMGARDLSIISTPPPNRYPVTTILQPYDEVVIRGAIEYELSRGGQVYFLHDKVKNIAFIADMVRKLVPGVKVGVGHGQLEGHKLEEVMMDFIEGNTDVLVCTTIVENGLDIPNANTIIVNEAQNFGLSDLHQLRGRVGRSNKKAYCYLLAPSPHLLPDLSRKRLQAIEQFSDLGSGIHIAMKDLDIRGAGDLLGAEQSGFINDIGFETYHKILEEAVRELKDEHFKELFADAQDHSLARGSRRDQSDDCIIEGDLPMLIPNSYVQETAERLSLYRRLADITNEDELQRFAAEVTDRFGPLPHEVNELMEAIRLRWLGQQMGLEKMIIKHGDLRGTFIADQKHAFFESGKFQGLLRTIQAHPKRYAMFERKGTLRISIAEVRTVAQAKKALEEALGG
ncbi:MAG: transcription-repair coupling factor [Flavobacteriales bacterium]|nr:transcription-repair coupling factor [Flavobacteriales bacterium]MEB2341377.1 transcription-repair coupling factor [Flavobacteriia bacterium]